MPTTIHLDPITRIEGHLQLEAVVDLVNGRQQVVDAKVGGTLFRGIEKILAGRSPLDAPDIAQRICGVCPVSQGLAATLTLEAAGKMQVPENARVMRNLILAADHIHSHILHFYTLAALDFVDGPAMPPWQPSWKADKRITGAAAGEIVNHYVQALDYRRKAHEMGALFAGRLPHSPAMVPGGFTTTPRAERITKFRAYLDEIASFVRNVYVPDVQAVAGIYSDYFTLGAGRKNLLAYGCYDLDTAGAVKLFRRGLVRGGSATVEQVNPSRITESVSSSWYDNAGNNLNPSNGVTNPVYPKNGAYSWLKAPRYDNAPFEVGPLARMWVSGDYRNGISIMDRHMSRALETVKIVDALRNWLGELSPGGSVYSEYSLPVNASGIGFTEAPRGALAHWIQTAGDGKISRYQIVSPTCWNASPKDSAGVRGPIEQALIGLPVQDASQPVEISRLVRSFDPCLGCAVQVMRPGEKARVFTLRGTGR